MQINNICNMAIQTINLISGASLAGITANLVVKTLGLEKVEDKESNLSGNVEITAEDFSALQTELEDLKTEFAELKGAQTETKPGEETSSVETQTSAGEEIVAETTPAPKTEDMKAEQTKIETKTETEAKTTLKEIDIYNLTQSEANQIWTSYLKGQCEYDLNDGNIKEFCTKFGFDINYAKN